MKIKQYAAAYLVIFFVLFSGDIKETFAKKNISETKIKLNLSKKLHK